jgi:hypothetical protein
VYDPAADVFQKDYAQPYIENEKEGEPDEPNESKVDFD